MKYKDLASAIQLAINEYEFYNKINIEGLSFSDLINWLDHFGCHETTTDKKFRGLRASLSVIDDACNIISKNEMGLPVIKGEGKTCREIFNEEDR